MTLDTLINILEKIKTESTIPVMVYVSVEDITGWYSVSSVSSMDNGLTVRINVNNHR